MSTEGEGRRLFEARHEGCPSELVLDRMAAGELDAAATSVARLHAETCARCRARMALRERGLAAFASLDAERLEQRIIGTARFRRVWIAAGPIALAASIAAAVVLTRVAPEDTVTAKGALQLRVFRERGGDVTEVASGDRFRAGDRLRFGSSFDPAERREIMIIGAERGAKPFVYYPAGGSSTSAAPILREDGALQGAIELDEHRGEEWLHLISCPQAFGLEEVQLGDAPDAVRAPASCRVASFVMYKE